MQGKKAEIKLRCVLRCLLKHRSLITGAVFFFSFCPQLPAYHLHLDRGHFDNAGAHERGGDRADQ